MKQPYRQRQATPESGCSWSLLLQEWEPLLTERADLEKQDKPADNIL
jgi:hypothetical protein